MNAGWRASSPSASWHALRRRKGTINRAILVQRAGESTPLPLAAYVGTKYSFREHLSDGHMAYRLRSLGGRKADEHDLAPESVLPYFVRVLTDCMVPAE